MSGALSRVRVALAMLAFVGAALTAAGIARAETIPITQSSWATRKQSVLLPNGLAMAYVEAGDPKGEPLLLLHGYTDSSRSWALLVPHLARYRLIIPDLRGHGASGAPLCCYSLSNFADDARLLLDRLGIERTAVAGHSLGSMIAIGLAADHPGRVSRIVLIGATVLVPVQRGDWLYDNVAALKWPLDPSTQFMRDWHPANQPTPVDLVFAKAVRAEYMTIPPHVWRGVMRELAAVPIGRHAADIKGPVLILSGGKDPIFTAEHHAALVQAFPQAKAHVFPDLGHNPNWEQPAEIARHIAEFLESSR